MAMVYAMPDIVLHASGSSSKGLYGFCSSDIVFVSLTISLLSARRMYCKSK